VHALDLATGAERWQAGGLRAYDAAASSALLFAGRAQPDGNGGTVALDALTGRVVATLPYVGGATCSTVTIMPYRYSGQTTAFVAFDGTSGREMWESLGTGGIGGPPVLVGTTLLQSFSESGTVWVGGARSVAHADRHGVLRTVRLPNASSRLSALTVGCDGTLYAADALGTQLARISPDGALEEYPTGLFTIDALTTATDCRTWFVGGSNAPTQQVGTFTFTTRAARSR
jgi:hypothetical protein